MKERITVIFLFVACQYNQASCSSLVPDPIVDYRCISNRNSKMHVSKAQIFAWYMLSVVLFTVALLYIIRSLPIPEAETVVGDEVDSRPGNTTLAIIHIQKTGGKEFAIYFQNLQRKENQCVK